MFTQHYLTKHSETSYIHFRGYTVCLAAKQSPHLQPRDGDADSVPEPHDATSPSLMSQVRRRGRNEPTYTPCLTGAEVIMRQFAEERCGSLEGATVTAPPTDGTPLMSGSAAGPSLHNISFHVPLPGHSSKQQSLSIMMRSGFAIALFFCGFIYSFIYLLIYIYSFYLFFTYLLHTRGLFFYLLKTSVFHSLVRKHYEVGIRDVVTYQYIKYLMSVLQDDS